MSSKTMNGDQAMAYGALSGGVKLTTYYPGGPRIGKVQTLITLAKKHQFYVKWSWNEIHPKSLTHDLGVQTKIVEK